MRFDTIDYSRVETMLAWPAGLLAAATMTLGIAVFLGSFLFYDRA